MTIVAVCAAGGSAASTTTAVRARGDAAGRLPDAPRRVRPVGRRRRRLGAAVDVAGLVERRVGRQTDRGRRSATTPSSCRPGSRVMAAPARAVAGAHRGRRGGTWVRRAAGGGARRRRRSPTAAASSSTRRCGRRRRSSRCCSSASRWCRRRRRSRASIGRSRRSGSCAARAARSASCSSAALRTARPRSPPRSAPSCSACFPEDAVRCGARRRRVDRRQAGIAQPARQGGGDARRAGHRGGLRPRPPTGAAVGRGGRRRDDAAPPRQPIDPTLGELPRRPARPLVRAIADTVGKRVARKVQESLDAGARMSADAEKVASVTEIHRELAGVQRGPCPRRAAAAVGPHPPGRARRGDGARLRPRRARRPVGQRRRREHRRQRAEQGVRHVRRRRAGALDAGRRRPGRADRPDPPGRPPARRQRGRVRCPPSAARSAAARRRPAVRRVRRRRRQRRRHRAAAVDPPAPLPRRVDGRPRRARRAPGRRRRVHRRRVPRRREPDRRRRPQRRQDDVPAGGLLRRHRRRTSVSSRSRRTSPSSASTRATACRTPSRCTPGRRRRRARASRRSAT